MILIQKPKRQELFTRVYDASAEQFPVPVF